MEVMILSLNLMDRFRKAEGYVTFQTLTLYQG